MNAASEIIGQIKQVKSSRQWLSNEEMTSVLYEIKKIAKDKTFINNLIFLYTQLRVERKNIELLSKREKEVLLLIGAGHQTKVIATKLNLTASTVETHRKNMRRKLQLKGNGKLLQFAILYYLKAQKLS